jgi:hypothetical protein
MKQAAGWGDSSIRGFTRPVSHLAALMRADPPPPGEGEEEPYTGGLTTVSPRPRSRSRRKM